MRHVDVAREFVCKRKATGSRMFCEDTDKGFTVFSYGHHFPIARHTDFGYVFNSSGYSSSTSTHKSYVKNVLYGDVVELPDCNEEKAAEQIKDDKNEIDRAKDKIKRVRSKSMYDYWKETIEERQRNIELIKKHIVPNQVLEALE